MKEHRNNDHHCRHQTTLLRKCHCGHFHLHYKYVMLTIPKKTLFHIMEECYAWDEMRKTDPVIYENKPMKLMVGMVTITVDAGDFDEFNTAIQQGSSEALNIEALVGHANRKS